MERTTVRRWRRNPERGFTLIELLVALVVFSIIIGIGLPSLVRWNRAYRLSGATRELIADMQFARVKAIRQNAMVTVVFTGGGYDASYGSDPNAVLFRSVSFPRGVTLTIPTPFANDRLQFNNRGVLQGGNEGNITLNGVDDDRTVRFLITGKVAEL